MTRTSYQLMKNDEPIAIGSMSHCLDVFYWEIYYGYNHLEYNIVSFRQDEEVYRKAKAYDLLREDIEINEKVFKQQAENDEVSAIIHGHYLALLEQSELEGADDER